MSIFQFLTGHLPLVLCTLHEACRLLDAEKSLPIGYELEKKALVNRTEIGDREGETTDYGNLGTVFRSRGQYNTTRLKSISKKRLSLQLKLATDEGKHHVMET